MLAFWLRFDLEPPQEQWRAALATLPWVVVTHALIFWRFGLYRALWRYANILDLQRIVAAVAIAEIALAGLITLATPAAELPRTVFLIAPLLLIIAMGGSRMLFRAWREQRMLGGTRSAAANPVIVLGAGAAASALLHDLASSGRWRAVALLDDDASKRGGAIQDVKVVGTLASVKDVAERMGVTQAIIAMPGAAHAARTRALNLCHAAGLHVMTVPSYADIVSGKVSVSQLREVELDDLLGRDPVILDDARLSGFLKGKTVLVTGAGGSIGAELCRQIERFEPACLVLLESSEYALYLIEQEFRDRHPRLRVVPAIGDAKD